MTARATRRHLLAGMGAAAIGAIATAATASGTHPDAELLGLLAEFDALEAKIIPPDYGSGSADDDDAHDLAVAPLLAEQKRVLAKICETRATTLDGYRARALSLIGWDRDMADKIAAGDDPDGYHDDRMVTALIRDLVAGGAA